MLEIRPSFAQAHFNIALCLDAQGRKVEAEARYREAIRLDPTFTDAATNLGNLLRGSGRLQEAEALHRSVVDRALRSAPVWLNLAVSLKELGRLADAQAACREALRLDPGFANARNNLGNVLLARGDSMSPSALSRPRCGCVPGTPMSNASGSRAQADRTRGRCGCRRSRGIPPRREQPGRPHARGLSARRPVRGDDTGAGSESRVAARRARDRSGRSRARHRQRAARQCRAGAAANRSGRRFRRQNAGRAGGVRSSAALATDDAHGGLRCSLRALLHSSARGAAFRRCATARGVLRLSYGARAPVFPRRVRLRRIGGGGAGGRSARPGDGRGQVSADAVAMLACYRPLGREPVAETLCGRTQLAGIASVIAHQVTEPAEEAALAAALPSLAPIEDGVSRQVRTQYEENPYPRWRKAGLPEPLPFGRAVRQLFPGTAFDAAVEIAAPRILVAGCGTGKHALLTACRYANSRVTAVDLSRASLAYGARQARSLSIRNIQFVQGDILDLGCLESGFDLVESFGVLHHLRDPMAGWRVLADLVKPGGLMMIGLYSERARWPVVEARRIIAERGYPPTLAGIRQFRADLRACGDARLRQALEQSVDFYSASGCRDLLFHVQEHRYTAPLIEASVCTASVGNSSASSCTTPRCAPATANALRTIRTQRRSRTGTRSSTSIRTPSRSPTSSG
ncbi:MAG: tetratricopeptide repeat protein [Betaproteobacteria bacterium]|nr:tetratricopeptide repeat protein [Betaproteobacteria bacterium]